MSVPPQTTDPPAGTAPQWWTDFLDQFGGDGGWSPNDEDLQMFANAIMMMQMQQQMGGMDYQNRYMDYLEKTIGLNEQQLLQAQQELEFQSGPYFDWYTNDYFPAIQEQERLRLETSQITSQNAQNQSKDYALAQAYNTETAKLGTEAARYNMMAQQGLNWEMPSMGATGGVGY